MERYSFEKAMEEAAQMRRAVELERKFGGTDIDDYQKAGETIDKYESRERENQEKRRREEEEFRDTLEKAIEGEKVFPQEVYQKALDFIREEFVSHDVTPVFQALNAVNFTFTEKYTIIAEIFECLASVAPVDGYERRDRELWEALKVYKEKEKNFFLRNLTKSFLEAEYKNYDINEKKKWVSNLWERGSFYDNEDGTTGIAFPLVGEYMSFGRKINSPEELTDIEVEMIASNILASDHKFESPNKEKDGLLKAKYKDAQLSKTTLPASVIPGDGFFHVDNIDDELDRRIELSKRTMGYGVDDFTIRYACEYVDSLSITRLAPGIGGVYEEGKLISVFPVEKGGQIDTESKVGFEGVRGIMFLIEEIDRISAKKESMTSEGGEHDFVSILRRNLEVLKSSIPGELYEKIEGVVSNVIIWGNKTIESDVFMEIALGARNELIKILKQTVESMYVDPVVSVDDMLKDLPIESNVSGPIYESMMSLRMRVFLEDYFDISIARIPVYAQVHFLQFISEKSDEQINKVKEFIGVGDEQERIFRLTAFLSLEYGEDYGDIIMKIGEGDPKYAKEVFRQYVELNDRAIKIGRLLQQDKVLDGLNVPEDIKGMFPRQIAEAVLRRAKDILNTAAYLTDHDFAEVPYYGDKVIKVTDEEDVIQGLKEYINILKVIENFITKPQSFEFISQEGVDVSTFHYKRENSDENSYFSIQLREYGASIGQHNVDIEYDGEARINLLFSEKPMTSSLSDPARQDALSLRIDREGKMRDGNKIIGNDPTRKDGEISLEVGSVNHDDQTLPSAVIGRVVSVGNYLGLHRNEKLEKEHPQYYHNRESFSRTLGDADVFAEIVRKIKQMLPKQ